MSSLAYQSSNFNRDCVTALVSLLLMPHKSQAGEVRRLLKKHSVNNHRKTRMNSLIMMCSLFCFSFINECAQEVLFVVCLGVHHLSHPVIWWQAVSPRKVHTSISSPLSFLIQALESCENYLPGTVFSFQRLHI